MAKKRLYGGETAIKTSSTILRTALTTISNKRGRAIKSSYANWYITSCCTTTTT